MHTADERWVPKVHPLARDAHDEDPYELMATPAAGDPEVMLECILQEFLWMGFGREQLVRLFHDPNYPMLCELREFYGPVEIERRVDGLLARCGQLRFREIVAEPDEPAEDHGLELLQILPAQDSSACR
jgi:hypothetical protein